MFGTLGRFIDIAPWKGRLNFVRYIMNILATWWGVGGGGDVEADSSQPILADCLL